MRETLLAALLGLSMAAAAFGAEGRPAVRFFVPHVPYSQQGDRELTAIVEEYNRDRPVEARVELRFRGENFSSLKNVVASHLAGDTPEIAAIENSELAAVRRLGIPRPVRLTGQSVTGQSVTEQSAADAIPFQQTVPVLLVDQAHPFPKTWAALQKLARDLAAPRTPLNESHASLALPLSGSPGLWIFEALSGKALWRRETGGLRANRELKPLIADLQRLIDSPGAVRPEETWERSIQAFLDRRSPILVTSLDSLPYLSLHSTFRWNAGLLPVATGEASSLLGGNHLILTHDTPAARAFLKHLYSPKIAMRWVAQGNFLPLQPNWEKSEDWKKLTRSMPAYSKLIAQIKAKKPRATDADVVRAHSQWIQSLRLLFTDSARRVPSDSVLTQMDTDLSLGSY